MQTNFVSAGTSAYGNLVMCQVGGSGEELLDMRSVDLVTRWPSLRGRLRRFHTNVNGRTTLWKRQRCTDSSM